MRHRVDTIQSERSQGDRSVKLPIPILHNRVRWLVNLRWIACAGVAAVVGLSSAVFNVVANPVPLYIIAGAMVAYNSALAVLERRRHWSDANLDRNICIQMTLDQIALILLLYFSGVPYNPFIFYFVFHMTIAALLLHGRTPYFFAGLASFLAGSVLLSEYLGWIPIWRLELEQGTHALGGPINELDEAYLVGFFVAFSTTLWITVYFTSSVHNYLHKAQSVIRQQEKMLGISQLVAGIAHQISNPLDGIQNCLKTIGRSVKEDERLSKYVELMTEALERIERTAQRVQTFARPHGMKLEATDGNKAIETVVALLGNVQAQGVEIIVESGHVPPVLSDQYTLQEVIFNLCTNALTAMPNGGTLSIRTFLPRTEEFSQFRKVAIEVVDTGCGIDRGNIERIFEPFFTTRAAGGGTGLGLTLCRMLISEMGGRMEVDSMPGRGTTFRVILNATEHNLEIQKES